MGEMKGFIPVPTNPLDWAKNLISSLDPYTQKIAIKKLFSAYRKGSSAESVTKFLKQLSAISIQRTADRLTDINYFSHIGEQDQWAAHQEYLQSLREKQRAQFDEMMASPLSPNRLSATYDDILIGREEASRKEYEQLRDYYADIEIKQAEERKRKVEAEEQYNAYVKESIDPIGARKDALKKRFGGGSFGEELADKAIKVEAEEQYRRDMLSDYDKRFEDLTERYGGGEKGEKMAIQMMAKNNIFLKSISKELPGLTKTILKATPGIKKGLGVSSTIFGAWRYTLSQQRGWAGLSTAGGRMGIDPAMAIAANTTLGGKSLGGGVGSLKLIGNWETAIGRMMRGGSTEFLADLEKYGVDVRGSGFGGFATGEEIFTAVVSKIRQYKKSGNKNLALALADIAGIDAAVYEAMDHVKDGDVLGWIRRTGEMSGADAVAKQRGDTIRDEAGERTIFEWVKSRLFSKANQPQNAPEGLLSALSFGFMDLSKLRATQNIANQSASLPSQSVGAAVSYGGHSNVSVNVGGVVVNTDNAERLGADIISGAMTSPGSRAAIANSLDPMTMK